MPAPVTLLWDRFDEGILVLSITDDQRSFSISLAYDEIPQFTPECFAWLHSSSTAQFKRFREGLEQLLQEGVVQSFFLKDSAQRVPLLAAAAHPRLLPFGASR